MRRVACAAALLPALWAASAGAGVRRVGCAQQSFITARGSSDADLTIGPLILGGWRDAAALTARDYERYGHAYKAAVLLRPGHRATIRVARRSRGVVRLRYAGITAPAIRFVACSAGAGSTLRGEPIVFWPGALVLARFPACARFVVRVDDREPRRLRLPVGRGACA